MGLVEVYSIKSADAVHLRKLAVPEGKRGNPSGPLLRQARRLSPEEVAGFLDAYREGANVREQARTLGIHRSTLHELVRRHGVKRLPPVDLPKQVGLVEAYEQGATLSELAAIHGIGPNRIARQIRAAGGQLRSRGRRPE